MEILSGTAAHTVFGEPFTPPAPSKPEANGHRVMFSPKTAHANDVFLSVMTMSDDKVPETPLALAETPATFALTVADRVVVLSKTGRLVDQPFPVTVPAGRNYRLLLAGLAPGNWNIHGGDGKFRSNARVEAGKNTAFVVVPGGRYLAQPDTSAGQPATTP
jgi:heparin/heparan-sulfate lyase